MYIQFSMEELMRKKIINIEDPDIKIKEDFKKYLCSVILKSSKFKNITVYICRNMTDNISRIECYIPLRMFNDNNNSI